MSSDAIPVAAAVTAATQGGKTFGNMARTKRTLLAEEKGRN
jgi:hypothetical protein